MTIRNQRERITKAVRQFIYQRDRGLCQICYTPVPRFCYHIDHRIPVAHGGSSIVSNLRLAHQSCNTKRGTGKRLNSDLADIGTRAATPDTA